jgi:hypothetical protein
MSRGFIFLALALAALVLLRVFLTAQPAQLARLIRASGGLLLLASSVFLMARGLVVAALPLAALGIMALVRSNLGVGQARGGRTSEVRSAGLEMTLDHDSGEMDGVVLAGRFEGSTLSQMSLEDLLRLTEDFGSDEESLRLLESYLDRAHPGWREDIDERSGKRSSPPSRTGGMSTDEAYEILGLKPGASDTEIRAAHRRLMMQVHPDRGGSGALAAKINEAKDLLLGNHD